jgi:tRNA-2-methylthio-N6-dimethylallyladenosine synthase
VVRPGDVVSVPVTYGAPHHLMSDAVLDPSAVRRTRSGDAWEARTAAPAEPPKPGSAMLGMPQVGVPAQPVVSGPSCSCG